MTPQPSCRARARAGNGAAGGNGGNSQPGLFPGGNGGVAGNGGDASAMGCCTTAVTSVAIAGNGGLGGTGGRGCNGGDGGCGGRAGWAVTNVVEGTFSGGGAAAASGIGGAGGPGGPGGGAPVCNGGNGGHGGPVALALANSTCGAPAQVQGAAGLGGTAGFGNPAGAPGVAGLSGTPCTAPLGCSDGSEEAYGIANNCPGLSACAGGWSLPGVLGTPVPACGRVSGNTSVNPSGAGCTVSDLCGVGFHVCRNDADIVAHLSPGCVSGSVAGAFYATGQSTNGAIRLATGVNTSLASCNGSTSVCGCAQTMWTANDLAGVGGIGLGTLCAAGGVNRTSNDNCMSLQGANCAVAPTAWQCPSTGFDEAHTVTKGSSSCGGVLCCMDP